LAREPELLLLHARLRAQPRGQLEEQLRIVVLGEEPEEHASRVEDRRRVLVPAVLEQAPHGVNRADSLEVVGTGRRRLEHRVVPDAVRGLRERELDRRPERVWQELKALRYRRAKPRYVYDGAILYRR